MQMRRVLLLLDRVISKFSRTVGVIAIFGMIALIFPEVTARYVFNHSFGVSEEFSSYLLVVAIFIGLAFIANEDSHIRVQVIVSRLPPRIYGWLRAFTFLLFLLLSIILTKVSWDFVLKNYAYGTKAMYLTQTSLWIPILAIPVGFGLLCLILMVRFLRSIDKLHEDRQ